MEIKLTGKHTKNFRNVKPGEPFIYGGSIYCLKVFWKSDCGISYDSSLFREPVHHAVDMRTGQLIAIAEFEKVTPLQGGFVEGTSDL